MPDGRMDFATTLVATAPSPATTGTTLTVTTGDGAKFPAAPFNVVICPAATAPTTANAEIARVTSKGTGDNWTIVRLQDGTYIASGAARTVIVGDQVFLAPVASLIDQLAALPSYASGLNLTGLFALLQGICNYKSSNTRHADQGLTNASRVAGGGVGYTREMAIGDSVTAGCTSGVGTITYDRPDAWPYAMRDTLAIWGIPANGTGLYRCQDNTTVHSAWAFGANWSGNVTYSSTTTVGANTTMTVDRPGSMVDVFYADGFTGTFSVSVNGAASGAGFASVTAAGVLRTGKKRLSVQVFPGSTIKITCTTAGTGVGLIGASVWSPNGGLVMDIIAQSGSRLGAPTSTSVWTDFTTSTAPWQVYGGTYKGGISGKSRQVTDVAITTGSAQITSATAAFDADRDTGEPIDFVPDVTLGIAFTPGTYILSVTNSTTAVLSTTTLYGANATNKTANITRDPSAVHICLGGNDLQNARTGANIAADLTTLVTTIRTQWPNCDVICHLENELAPANASAAQELDMQQSVFKATDPVLGFDSPLYDWRDRAGSYATGIANGIYQDSVAHMTPAMYTNLGAALAFARCVAGSGPQQAPRGPFLDNDVVPKWYSDGFRRFVTPIVANVGTTFTATEQVVYQVLIPPAYLKVGSTFRLIAIGSITGTGPQATARLRVGTAGTTSDTQIVTTTGLTFASGAAFRLVAEITVRAIGASGTIIASTFVGGNNVTPLEAVPATATVDTTGKLWFSLTGLGGGTTPVGTTSMAWIETVQL